MKEMYECIIIGGGLAGLQASIQLGRYNHDVLVIDSHYGRSTLCKSYHNLLGWPEGVSGETLRQLGRQHAEQYNIEFLMKKVVNCVKNDDEFVVTTGDDSVYRAKTLLLATGVMDRLPNIPNISACLGLTVYVCPDCDGYEVTNRRVIVIGANEPGANLALTLTHWTKEIVYVNNGERDLDASVKEKLLHANIAYTYEKVSDVLVEEESSFKGVTLQSGEVLYADRAFIAFGGNAVHSELAGQLGVKLLENRHIEVDPRTKETNVANVWAAGDVTAHSQQAAIAMGDGVQAAIWIHKRLLES